MNMLIAVHLGFHRKPSSAKVRPAVNVSEAIQELKAKNIKLIDNTPRELLGTKYAFIHHPNKLNGVLTELIEGDIDFNKQ